MGSLISSQIENQGQSIAFFSSFVLPWLIVWIYATATKHILSYELQKENFRSSSSFFLKILHLERRKISERVRSVQVVTLTLTSGNNQSMSRVVQYMEGKKWENTLTKIIVHFWKSGEKYGSLWVKWPILICELKLKCQNVVIMNKFFGGLNCVVSP